MSETKKKVLIEVAVRDGEEIRFVDTIDRDGKERRYWDDFRIIEQGDAREAVVGHERYRVEKTKGGFWPNCVRAGDGTRELFVGHAKQCEVVAAELACAFEDGKYIASRAAPEPQSRQRAPDGLIKKIAVQFYYWWHNRPGSNTADGFDEWVELGHLNALLLTTPQPVEGEKK